MRARLLRRVADTGRAALRADRRRPAAATEPATPAVRAGALTDLPRSEPAPLAENARVRQQLVVLRRLVKRPRGIPLPWPLTPPGPMFRQSRRQGARI